MKSEHNPDSFMADLRQILAQGKKRIGLLVGAGAPVSVKVNDWGDLSQDGSPLIPGVEELTRTVIAALKGPQHQAAVAISDALGGDANIEAILSRVRLLEIALGQTEVHGLNGVGYQALGKAICDKIGSVVGPELPRGSSSYTELISWISGTMRAHPVEIFCTNYDLLFEEAFERVRAPYFDGFSGGFLPFFDPVSVAGNDLPARWSRLWKIHGSLGWALKDGAVVRGQGRDASQLVYPDHLKYDLTQKQPYAALFERLKRFLLTPDTLLLTIGFSFRDAHVCAVIDESLAVNSNTAVFAFQYRALSEEFCAAKLALDRPNLSVYAADGAVIGGISGNWRPGELPKNWQEIRSSFWGLREGIPNETFLLGDFTHFSRFCALAQAVDFSRATQATLATDLENGETA